MTYKIMLDAGHGGEDPGAVYNGRQEKDDNLRLVMAIGNILEQSGVDVLYTRTTDIYQTPFQKAQIANESGADFFISIHRNSSPVNNQYSGVETLVYDKSGIKLEMAENINAQLAKVGFENLGVKARPGLVVLRRTRMPALLVEVGFLNTDKDNMLFDERFDEIAQAIADGILMTLDIRNTEYPGTNANPSGSTPPADMGSTDSPENEMLYRVQVGLFRNKENADRLNYELLNAGYPSFILHDGEFYKVQVGAYAHLVNAVIMEQRLRKAGYPTFITTK